VSNENQTGTPTDVPSGTPATPKKAEKKQGGNLLSWINLVLILTLAVLAGFAAWLGLQYQQQTAKDMAVMENNLDSALEGLKTSSNREAELDARARQLADLAESMQAQVEHNTEMLAKLPGAERQDWLLAEAEYLLRLGNQRLELERDWDGAVSMLTAADNVLVETRNPAFNKVRALIAKELIALRAVPAIDRVGAIYRLQALQEQVTSLPWMPEKLIEETVLDQEAQRPLDQQTWYWDLFYDVRDSLKRMVRIRERDEPIAAPLTPDQQYYLQQNMHLMLEQAQVALLREQTELYQHSLGRVADWLNQYLIIEDERTLAARNALSELQGWTVDPERPDISASLTLLQKIVEQQRRGTVIASEPAAAESSADAAEGNP
tara:strand:+ start:37602 stop:38735 length:1134 start_codon:yes stop_codon:yes gene_type:complete